jgi:hypothetical protein
MMYNSLEDDCRILLERALVAKLLAMFGEDGNGDYGRNDRAVFTTIQSISMKFVEDPEGQQGSDIYGVLGLFLLGYDARLYGHATTDTNLRISLNVLLDAAGIDREALYWAPITMQGQHTIVLFVDIGLLLAWK